MNSAGDDKQKINSKDKLPKEQEYICEICMAGPFFVECNQGTTQFAMRKTH